MIFCKHTCNPLFNFQIGGFILGLRKLQIQGDLSQIQVGSGLTLEDWANLVHPQSDGYVAVATKNAAGEWVEKCYPSSEWAKKLVRHKDLSCYVSVNSFFIPKRNTKNARQINAFYVDLDYYKEALSQDEVLQALDFLTRTERLPEPTAILDSGQGMYGMWLIESVPAKFKSVQKLYTYIEKHLIDVLKDVGSDPQASDITRVLKAPSTYHFKTGKMVEVLRYSEKRYTMRYMQDWFNDSAYTNYDLEEIKKREADKKSKPKIKKNSKLKRLFNRYTLAIARVNDLQTLCEMRNYELNGKRNMLIHIYTYQLFLIHDDIYVVRSKVVTLNEKLIEPLLDSEIKEIIRSTQRAYKGHLEDKSKGYNYYNSTIIKNLDITTDEQRHLTTLINKEVKQERNTVFKREQRRDDNGLTARERAKQEKIEQVLTLREKGLKQTEIAEKIGVTVRYVKKILNGK